MAGPGDGGRLVASSLGQQDAAHLAGIHVMPLIAPPDPATLGDLTEAERVSLAELREAAAHELGYSAEQSTKPQTVGYGLVDSPAGLAAWIGEKFWSWTDHDGSLDAVISRDDLIDDLMLYWLPGTAASSARLYRHPALERAGPGRPLRRLGAAGHVRGRGTDVLPPGPAGMRPRRLGTPSRTYCGKPYPAQKYTQPAEVCVTGEADRLRSGSGRGTDVTEAAGRTAVLGFGNTSAQMLHKSVPESGGAELRGHASRM